MQHLSCSDVNMAELDWLFTFDALEEWLDMPQSLRLPFVRPTIFLRSLFLFWVGGGITFSLFIIPANLDRSPGQRQITPSRVSNLINLQPPEGITLPMNNYLNPVTSGRCQNAAITHPSLRIWNPWLINRWTSRGEVCDRVCPLRREAGKMNGSVAANATVFIKKLELH